MTDVRDRITVTIEDETGLGVGNDPQIREIAKQLEQWVGDTRAGERTKSSLFDRDKYAAPDNPYVQMQMARSAASDDDVVSGALDVLESLAIQGTSWESSDPDAAHIMNKVSEDIGLDDFVRTCFRELITYGQFVGATRWTVQEFQAPRRPDAQRSSRKKYRLAVPMEVTTLDPSKVVPVGSSVFGRERLAWNALPEERSVWDLMVKQHIPDDPMMFELFSGAYNATERERLVLQDHGITVDNLLELNAGQVWRKTLTKSRYEPWAGVPLKSVFRLLDLKQQLIESDRVVLAGIANYIILVRKGKKDEEATQEELENVRGNFQRLAKIPVVISDHRLEIDIIAPKFDHVLEADRYDTVDARILNRMLGSLDGGDGGSGDVEGQVRSRMIQRVLENRRRMVRDAMQRFIRDAIWNNPLNAQALKDLQDDVKPAMVYTPRNVQIDNDSQLIQLLVQLREKKEISRHTILEFMGLDQAVEHRRRLTEKELYDDDFGTIVPFDGANNEPGSGDGDGSGDKGGRPAGGGTSPRSSNGVTPKASGGGAKKGS